MFSLRTVRPRLTIYVCQEPQQHTTQPITSPHPTRQLYGPPPGQISSRLTSGISAGPNPTLVAVGTTLGYANQTIYNPHIGQTTPCNPTDYIASSSTDTVAGEIVSHHVRQQSDQRGAQTPSTQPTQPSSHQVAQPLNHQPTHPSGLPAAQPSSHQTPRTTRDQTAQLAAYQITQPVTPQITQPVTPQMTQPVTPQMTQPVHQLQSQPSHTATPSSVQSPSLTSAAHPVANSTVKTRRVFTNTTVVSVANVNLTNSTVNSSNPSISTGISTSTSNGTPANMTSKRQLLDDEPDQGEVCSTKKQRTRCLEMFKKGKNLLVKIYIERERPATHPGFGRTVPQSESLSRHPSAKGFVPLNGHFSIYAHISLIHHYIIHTPQLFIYTHTQHILISNYRVQSATYNGLS